MDRAIHGFTFHNTRLSRLDGNGRRMHHKNPEPLERQFSCNAAVVLTLTCCSRNLVYCSVLDQWFDCFVAAVIFALTLGNIGHSTTETPNFVSHPHSKPACAFSNTARGWICSLFLVCLPQQVWLQSQHQEQPNSSNEHLQNSVLLNQRVDAQARLQIQSSSPAT